MEHQWFWGLLLHTEVVPFGTRQATSSRAGAKPGNTEHHNDVRVGETSATRVLANAWCLAKLKVDFQ